MEIFIVLIMVPEQGNNIFGFKFKFVTHLVSDGILSCPISNIEMKASSPMTTNSGPSLKTLLSYQYYDSKTC